MNKILVPTNFSQTSQWAVEVAMDIAKRCDVEIILLHVVELPTNQSFNAQGQIDMLEGWEEKLFTMKLIEKRKAQLEDLAIEVETAGIRVSQKLRLGNPYHGISSLIIDHNIDLVIMGTSSHSKIEKFLVGSITEKVVRSSKSPVLTIHEKPSTKLFKNIVYATSLSDEELAFSNVIKFAQEIYDATIHIVRINTRSNFIADISIKEIMASFAEKIKLKKYTLNIFNDVNEEDGILNFAHIIGADLIGIATHRRTGFVHVLAGSISEDVVNHSKKPVLTFLTK